MKKEFLRDYKPTKAPLISNCTATLSEYDGGSARIMISLPIGFAELIAENGVKAGGKAKVRITHAGQTFEAEAIETRIDTSDPSGKRLSKSAGVGSFSKMRIK
ncbi:hypothetical protein [Donghicola sp. XS_ASV15]|uniref:hypothetical protein n=1 Tax=Donghicola sp. XS_ASV15 TaxID=3241295 RepID=UPI003518E9FF